MKKEYYLYLVLAIGIVAVGIYASAVINIAALSKQVETNSRNLNYLQGRKLSPQQPPTPTIRPAAVTGSQAPAR